MHGLPAKSTVYATINSLTRHQLKGLSQKLLIYSNFLNKYEEKNDFTDLHIGTTICNLLVSNINH